MGIKDIKAETRHKLALNIHQAIIVYTIEFLIVTALIALITLACLSLKVAGIWATVIMICYGIVLFLVAMIACGMADFAMVDYYLASYKCKPYNIRRLGETLARGGLTDILKLNIIRTLLGFLLLLCLIVPGVIFLVRTSMASHLLIANPKMKASTALKASNKVMAGRTGEYLALCCSFAGWWLLGLVTLGLGFVFVSPYMNLAKTVYYKRKLQGDKAQYALEPQPLSPAPSAPRENYAEGGFVPVPEGKGKNKRPVENAGAPVDTLNASDVNRMNDVVRDVREVVIPDTVQPSTVETVSVEAVPAEPVNTENDAFVETVKPMTTQEVMDADVMSKKIDALFSDEQMKIESEKEKPHDPFDDFMNDFAVPKQDAEFKPLTRSTDKPDRDRRRPSPRDEHPEHTPRDVRVEHTDRADRSDRAERVVGTDRNDRTARSGRAETPPASEETSESRADRMRRERQDRIKNMRK